MSGRASLEGGRGAESPGLSRCTRRTALRLFAAGTGAALLHAAHAAAPQTDQPKNPSGLDPITAIDMAGRQRALSQRMVKGYLMIGQGFSPDLGRSILDDSRRRFEAQLGALQAYQPSESVRAALGALESEWKRLKAKLDAAPSREGAEELYDSSEAFTQSAHLATVAYEGVSGAPAHRLVGLAGRQGMLSERMAKFFFFGTWGIRGDGPGMELDNSRAHFTSAFIQIHRSPFASPAVKAHVEQLQRDWEPYKTALLASRNPAGMRQQGISVAMLSEKTLAGMEDLVALITKETRA